MTIIWFFEKATSSKASFCVYKLCMRQKAFSGCNLNMHWKEGLKFSEVFKHPCT